MVATEQWLQTKILFILMISALNKIGPGLVIYLMHKIIIYTSLLLPLAYSSPRTVLVRQNNESPLNLKYAEDHLSKFMKGLLSSLTINSTTMAKIDSIMFFSEPSLEKVFQDIGIAVPSFIFDEKKCSITICFKQIYKSVSLSEK